MTKPGAFLYGLGLLTVGVLLGREWDRIELPMSPERVTTVVETNGSRQMTANAIPDVVAADAVAKAVADAVPKAVAEAVDKAVADAVTKVVADAVPKVAADATPKVVADATPKVAADAAPKVAAGAAPSVADKSTATGSKSAGKAFPEKCDYMARQIIERTFPSGGNIMKATRCPEQDAWLEKYLDDYPMEGDTFVFLNFGCNKGYDSLKVAHDVSRNYETFDKSKWHNHLNVTHQGACRQAIVDNSQAAKKQELDLIAKNKPKRPVEVHCVEAMPGTYARLRHAADVMGVEEHGLHVHNYAVLGNAKDPPKSILFPDPPRNIGGEAFSMGDCSKPDYKPICTEVPAITIDDFVAKHLDKGSDDSNKRIPFITIDTEGFDFTLMKAGPKTLQRTDYLEFEFHKANDWWTQKLKDATDMLEGFGMTCYWSGRNKLWRITNCWVPVYGSFHAWSNVVCVNGQHQPELAARMEWVFYDTLGKTMGAALKTIPGLEGGSS